LTEELNWSLKKGNGQKENEKEKENEKGKENLKLN
jgi:hypothetical protein